VLGIVGGLIVSILQLFEGGVVGGWVVPPYPESMISKLTVQSVKIPFISPLIVTDWVEI
jgi:hypothetical protein